MSHTIYTGFAAMQSRMDALELISGNLANLQSPGFKQRNFYFEVVGAMSDPERTSLGEAINGPMVSARGGTDFTSGTLGRTDNPLDFGLTGDGFFVIKTPDGNRYTRDGHFKLGPNGELQTNDGFAVLGAGANGDQPIVLPQGNIEVSSTGQISVDGVVAATIKLTSLQNVSELRPLGASLFAAPQGAVEVPPDRPGVAQGFLESSNVNPTATISQMIGLMRSFELLSQAVRSINRDVDSRLINDLTRF